MEKSGINPTHAYSAIHGPIPAEEECKNVLSPVSQHSPQGYTEGFAASGHGYNYISDASTHGEIAAGPRSTLPALEDTQYDPYQVRPGSDDRGQMHGNDEAKARFRRPMRSMLFAILTGWWAEIAWLLISVGSLCALAMLLERFDNKPLPNWPAGITLNTVVALLSTISRSAFVGPVMEAVAQAKWLWFNKRDRPLRDYDAFDKASRGPAGSLQLVITSRARYVMCCCIGQSLSRGAEADEKLQCPWFPACLAHHLSSGDRYHHAVCHNLPSAPCASTRRGRCNYSQE